MKKLIPVLLVIFAACSTPSKDGYIIDAKINGKTPAVVLLQEYKDGEMHTIDSTEFLNGEFHFTGKVDLPYQCFLKIGSLRPFPFFIENSEINILANIDSLDQASITGSMIQNKFDAFNGSTLSFDKEMEIIYPQLKQETDLDLKNIIEAKLDSVYDAKMNFIKNYVKNNGSCVIAPYLISRQLIHSIDLIELEELTNTISPALKESEYTQKLITRIILLRTLQPSLPAPEFIQNDVDGNPVNLADFKGKYLLIDFWASWCGPCRRANPTVVNMFKKYEAKGFTILGISMDDNKGKWLKAIEKDQLIWTQVSSLEGWANPVCKQYGVNSIPHAILIDPEGNIVKRGIHANELDELLNGVLN